MLKTYEDFTRWKETPQGQDAATRPLPEIMKDLNETEVEAVRIFGEALISRKGERAAWEEAESFLLERGPTETK